MSAKKGILIVFEGIDGAGKSTQARLLLKRLRSLGFAAVSFREPTRGRWGREIKRLAKRADSLSPEEELTLFLKDREENVRRNLRPALARGKIIVLDRYYYSTIAYQGAKGLDPDRIRRLNERFAVKPDLVFVLDIRAGEGLGRIHHRKRKDLLFERERYLRKVGRIFRGLMGRRFVHLDAGRPKDELHAQVEARVLRLLKRGRPRFGFSGGICYIF
jgi:dTMP kinase